MKLIAIEPIKSCESRKRCVIFFKAVDHNGDLVRGKDVQICKVVDGKHQLCRKRRYRKGLFRRRVGGRHKAASFTSGEWVCEMKVRSTGQHVVSEPGVKVTVV